MTNYNNKLEKLLKEYNLFEEVSYITIKQEFVEIFEKNLI